MQLQEFCNNLKWARNQRNIFWKTDQQGKRMHKIKQMKIIKQFLVGKDTYFDKYLK